MFGIFLQCCLVMVTAAAPAARDSPAERQGSAARLDDWLGSWVSETGGFECERFGKAAVVCRSHWVTETGEEGQGLYVNRWDEDDEVFRSYRFYDTGQSGSGFMWVVHAVPFRSRRAVGIRLYDRVSTDEWRRLNRA